jgi:hypothetical protein
MRWIQQVTNGDYGDAYPVAPLRDPATMLAGCLSDGEAAIFWREVILPNSYLSTKDQAQVMKELEHGVSIWDYVHPAVERKLRRITVAPVHRPNQSIQALLTPTGQPMQAWMDAKFEEYIRAGAFVVVPQSFLKLVSPVSVEPRKPRWICDHRVLNEYLVPPQMRYDDLNSFRKEL